MTEPVITAAAVRDLAAAAAGLAARVDRCHGFPPWSVARHRCQRRSRLWTRRLPAGATGPVGGPRHPHPSELFSVPVMDRVDRDPAPVRWRNTAACADPGLDLQVREVFTTEASTTADPDAVALCAGCPVLVDCAGYTARARGLVGIWSGRPSATTATG